MRKAWRGRCCCLRRNDRVVGRVYSALRYHVFVDAPGSGTPPAAHDSSKSGSISKSVKDGCLTLTTSMMGTAEACCKASKQGTAAATSVGHTRHLHIIASNLIRAAVQNILKMALVEALHYRKYCSYRSDCVVQTLQVPVRGLQFARVRQTFSNDSCRRTHACAARNPHLIGAAVSPQR